MSLNSAGLREELKREEKPSVSPIEVSLDVPSDPLTVIRTEAGEHLTRELREVRTVLTDCYDQAIARLDERKWVPLDLVTQLVNKLSTETAAARQRATDLAQALDSTKGDVQRIRAECQTAVNAAQSAAERDRKETAARLGRELEAARAAARSTAAAEANVRTELAAVRKRYQEIVDAQMLQLVTFKRELEQATPKADQARAAEGAGPREAAQPAETAKTSAVTAAPRVERSRSGAPAFEAIEAALADSPPLGKWPTRAAV